MKLLQINIDHKITDAEFAAGRGATKDFGKLIAQQPGLLWKIWIGDGARSEVGGIYLFEDERAVRAFLDGPLFAQVKANPGFKRVETKLFDVDEECSAITRAPLPVGAKA